MPHAVALGQQALGGAAQQRQVGAIGAESHVCQAIGQVQLGAAADGLGQGDAVRYRDDGVVPAVNQHHRGR